MILESRINASSIDTSGSFHHCAELCTNCPRRTGERLERVKGWRGWLGKKEVRSVHSSPLRSGVLQRYKTNGRHGVFYGDGTENTGTVAYLNEDTAATFVEAVIGCEGPTEDANICRALGGKSLEAIYDLDESMERAIDELPVEHILASLAVDSTETPSAEIPDTEVFINNSEPLGPSLSP